MMLFENVDWKVIVIFVLLAVIAIESVVVLVMAIALSFKGSKEKERREAPFEEARVPDPPAPPRMAEAVDAGGEDFYLKKDLFVTASGDCYHEATCKHLESARSVGKCKILKACGVCNPRCKLG